MRRPVKLPGPLAAASRSISRTRNPAADSIPSTRGIRVRLWVRPMF